MSRARRRPASAPPLTHDELDELAVDLVTALAPHAGDAEKVRAVLSTWLDQQGTARLALIGLGVVRDVFSTHLTRIPAADVPPGALVLTERTHHDCPTA